MAIEMVRTGIAPENKPLRCQCSECGSRFNLLAKDLVSQADFRGRAWGDDSPYTGKCIKCSVCKSEITRFEDGHFAVEKLGGLNDLGGK